MKGPEMRRSAEQTAILLAVILTRSGQTRARVSVKTIKFLGRRTALRRTFAAAVADALAEYRWIIFEIESGFGAVQAKTLAAAKAVTANRWLTDNERRASRRDELDWLELEGELLLDSFQADDEDVED